MPHLLLGIDNVLGVITMGIGTVTEKRIALLAWGISKAEILKDTIEGENSSKVPANICRSNNNNFCFRPRRLNYQGKIILVKRRTKVTVRQLLVRW
jgi:hypothetical protein